MSLLEFEDVDVIDRSVADVMSEEEYEQLRLNSVYELVVSENNETFFARRAY